MTIALECAVVTICGGWVARCAWRDLFMSDSGRCRDCGKPLTSADDTLCEDCYTMWAIR